MKKTANKNVNANKYNYTTYKSGRETIIVWDDLAQMMMGNAMPPMGHRILKEDKNKGKK